MPGRAETDFDQYGDSYRDAVERSIGFCGADLDFFTRAKAEVLLGLTAREVGPPGELGFLDVGCGPGETDRFMKGRVGGTVGRRRRARDGAAGRAREPVG